MSKIMTLQKYPRATSRRYENSKRKRYVGILYTLPTYISPLRGVVLFLLFSAIFNVQKKKKSEIKKHVIYTNLHEPEVIKCALQFFIKNKRTIFSDDIFYLLVFLQK